MLQSSPARTRLRAARHRREPRRVQARRSPRGGCGTILWVGASLLIATSAGCSSQAPVDKAADQIDISAAKAPPPPPARGGQAATATPAPSTWKERQKAAAAKSLVTTTPVASIGAPVTEDDVRKVAAEIEQAVKAGDKNRLSGLFDYAAMAESAFNGLELTAKDRTEAEPNVRTMLNNPGSFLDTVMQATQPGKSYKLLRVATRRDCPVARFRHQAGDEGLNYHDLMLARRADGQVRIVDFYVLMAGNSVADTMRQLMVAEIAARPKGFFGQVSPQDREYLDAAPRMKQLMDAWVTKQYHLVPAIIDSLPASIRRMKPVMLRRMLALSRLDKTEELAAATNEYRRQFPDDPSCDLISIDSDFAQKRYDSVLVAVDRLDKAVGGDPGLDTMRAMTLLLMRKPEPAAEAARRALEYDATDLHAHKVLAIIAAAAAEYDKVAARFDEIREKGGSVPKEWVLESWFVPFSLSAAGKAWVTREERLPPGR